MSDGAARRIWEKLRRWKNDPVALVREEFKAEPDIWQAEAMEAIARPEVERLALKACKGPGKTTVLAWIILWFLLTRIDAKVGATSITGDNLDMNLWPEIAKWQSRSELASSVLQWTKTRVFNRRNPENWFAAARTWPKKGDAEAQSDALAGIHADHVLFVLDESGGYPQAVMTTAEAVLATGVETKIVQGGNPTHVSGPLHRACTVDRKHWYVVQVTGDPDNPKRSKRIKIDWARQQIESFGRDNPWVKVNVLGEFPEASINALLGVEEVEAAMQLHLPTSAYDWAQKRLGVDVARFGDDRTVIFPRQGLWAARPIVMRQARTTAIAARVAKAIVDWGAELTFVDDTGHWGHGVVDNLLTAGYPVIPVMYSDRSPEPRYGTVRDYIWMMLAEAVKAGTALPPIPELVGELTEPTYTFVGGKFVVEPKEQIKERIGRSPDLGDALAETWAIPDQPGQMMQKLRTAHHVLHDADPFDTGRDNFDNLRDRVLYDEDPFTPRGGGRR